MPHKNIKMVKNLLVIDYNASTNWYSKFKGIKLNNGEDIKVEQAGWEDIVLIGNSSNKSPIVFLKKANDDTLREQQREREFAPDFLLIRNFPSALHGESYRNVLLGFMFHNIPSVNSLQSIYMCSEKPIVYGALTQIQRTLGGYEKFPLISQYYYPNIRSCDMFPEVSGQTIPDQYPQVVKIGTVHSGYGKKKLDTHSSFEDFSTCMALHSNYYTSEPFINQVDYDLRLQKIGDQFRVYKRSSDSSWKNNWGNIQFESIDHVEERYQLWMEHVGELFDGLDMFALDVMVTKDGKEVIIEINDSSMGLMHLHEAEDNKYIVELAVQKMNKTFCL
jgi:glutathione synthase/RimK-type ligase-like ATP-grasp enzyme